MTGYFSTQLVETVPLCRSCKPSWKSCVMTAFWRRYEIIGDRKRWYRARFCVCGGYTFLVSLIVTDSINNKVKDNDSWIINGIYCEKDNGAGTGYEQIEYKIDTHLSLVHDIDI